MPHTVPGNELSPEQQARAKRTFVHRYTGDHTPTWATTYIYPVQFRDDADWLAHTLFSVNKDGSLTRNARYCESSPTFPFGHEVKVRPPVTEAVTCIDCYNEVPEQDSELFRSPGGQTARVCHTCAAPPNGFAENRYPTTIPGNMYIQEIISRITRLSPDERGELRVQLSRLELLV